MVDTVLLDLDGTLLHFSQKDFVAVYFSEIGKVFAKMGYDVGLSIEAVWVGTKAMILNDGSTLNAHRFWEGFAEHMGVAGERVALIEEGCDSFYANEFNAVRSVLTPCDIPRRLVSGLASKGYGVVLATNPLFPLCAVQSRLGWAGLDAGDFMLVTHYANSTFCKPNPGYYREIFTKIGREPQQCLMAGNNPAEDMPAGLLGAETFLVTDCLENEAGIDIAPYRSGSLAELELYLMSLPDLRTNIAIEKRANLADSVP